METDNPTNESKIPGIILKLVLGILIILIVVIVFNLFSKQNQVEQPQSAKVLKLTLTSPADNIATSEKTVVLNGSTGIKSVVTISSGNQSKIVETQSNHFSTTLNLKEGKNIITVVAYDPKTGESQTIAKEILMLDQDLTNL